MNELVKSLKNFIVRDIIYIIGGTSVMLSFLYLFNKTSIITNPASKVTYLYIAGLAYVIGYCMQEAFSFLHIVTTANYLQPWFLLRWLYRCLVREKWVDIFPDITKGPQRRQEACSRLREADVTINEKASTDNSAFRERITALMMIGTTMGPCFLVSGTLLLIKAVEIDFSFCYCPISFTVKTCFDLRLSIVLLLTSLLLIILSWIKAMQLMKITEDLCNFYRRFREYDP